VTAIWIPARELGVRLPDRLSDWLDDAACRGTDPELFFPDADTSTARAQVAAAKKTCRRCPVRGNCLSWALENGQEAGIWGGTTEEERRHLRRHPRSGLTRTGGITDGGGPCTSLTPNQKI
jgi:WhiB family redox-sensing transcriptional regulator